MAQLAVCGFACGRGGDITHDMGRHANMAVPPINDEKSLLALVARDCLGSRPYGVLTASEGATVTITVRTSVRTCHAKHHASSQARGHGVPVVALRPCHAAQQLHSIKHTR